MQTIEVKIEKDALKNQFGLTDDQLDQLTEVCVTKVAAAVTAKWEALAKTELKSTAPEYVQNIINVDKGRFAKYVVLTGVLPNMLEQGASAFDLKEGFKKSSKVRYTIPVYKTTKSGSQIQVSGGQWYLTIPFRIGTPGTLGQAGFSGAMPDSVYSAMIKSFNRSLQVDEIPSPYDVPRSRAAIQATANNPYYGEYTHKTSIYAGMSKRTAQYEKTSQNTYGTFRRAGENSDPLSWIHKGLEARHIAVKARESVSKDLTTIVGNEIVDFLGAIL